MGITRAGEQPVNLDNRIRQHELYHHEAELPGQIPDPGADPAQDPSIQSPALHNQVPAWSERGGTQQAGNEAPGTQQTGFRGIGAGLRSVEGRAPEGGTRAETPYGDSHHLHAHDDLTRARRGGGGGRTGQATTNALDYDTAHYALRSRTIPTDPQQRQQLRTDLTNELDRIYGQNNWTISGATTGSDQELRAMDALRQYGQMQRNGTAINHRGTESDLLVPGAGRDPTLRMTTQMDRQGRITADVHNTTGTPTPSRTFTSAADAQRAIEQDFGVRVRGRTADPNSRDFSQAELTQIYHSLSQLDATERSQIRGLDFIREGSPPANRPGDTSGLYSPNVATSNGTRTAPASITLYDSAFSGNGQGFVGSSAAANQHSQTTILHEVGHAIEDRRANDATVAFNQAVDARNTAANALNTANAALTQPLADMNRDGNAFVRAANSQMSRMSQAERQQTTDFNNARNGVTTAMNALNRARTPQQLAAAQTQLQTAVQARDAAFGRMGASHPLHSEAQSVVTSQDAAIAAAQPAAQRQVDFQQAVSAQAAAQRTLDGVSTGGQSARLRSFSAALRQDTSPTEYGRTGAAEAFAESFMLFKSDPQYLRQNRPNIYQWFQSGGHLR
jgi:hypothetical protein